MVDSSTAKLKPALERSHLLSQRALTCGCSLSESHPPIGTCALALTCLTSAKASQLRRLRVLTNLVSTDDLLLALELERCHISTPYTTTDGEKERRRRQRVSHCCVERVVVDGHPNASPW